MELDQVRKELHDIHSSRVKEYENTFKKAQLERQAVFQEAFQNDMECYKTLGTLPSKYTTTKIKIFQISYFILVFD